MKNKLSLLTLHLLICSTFSGWAEEKASEFHITLYHGQNEGMVDELKTDKKLKKSLVRLFGYTKYRKMGAAKSSITQTQPKTLTLSPSKPFQVKISPVQNKTKQYRFEFFHEKEALFNGKFIPKPHIPMIIKGPHYDKGVLIIVINTQNPQKQMPQKQAIPVSAPTSSNPE